MATGEPADAVPLGETEQEAQQIARNGAKFMFDSYLPPGVGAVSPPGRKTIPIDAAQQASETSDPVEHYVNEVVICGTPEKVIDDLLDLVDHRFWGAHHDAGGI